MTNFFDRAAEREEELRHDALEEQARRAGMQGKTIADSAKHCSVCDCPIPEERREAMLGVQTCLSCQADLERALRKMR